jgi:hypothetical protein
MAHLFLPLPQLFFFVQRFVPPTFRFVLVSFPDLEFSKIRPM